jgi:hypothetical protein
MGDDFFGSEGLYSGVLLLIGAMFRLAAQDVRYGKEDEVLEFVESEWFLEICDCLELDPKDVKKRIFSSKVKQRSEYH